MKFKMVSLGCKVNSYECSALSSLLISKGYKLDNNNPDVVIINTCSVTATADQKSRQHIRKIMNKYPDSISVVMGCYSQGNYQFIADEIQPTIIVGTSNRNIIPDLIEEYLKNKQRIVRVDGNPRKFSYEEFGITSYSDNVRAYLKIQDGCDNFCSYCLIPYRRGKSRSRQMNNIIEEAKYLINQGYEEIVLTGIHVGGYGKDISGVSFSDLVEKLLDIEGLNSLRISSIEESEIDDKLIHLFGTRKNLAKHLHIPLQSGCDSTLKRMNRKYNCEQFLNKITSLRKMFPRFALTTDVIVGFAGEDDDEFNQTVEFIKKCGFDMLHVFPFSPREGTPAYYYPHQVDGNTKNKRVQTLLDLSKDLWDKYTDSFIGEEVEVLVEKYVDGYNIGHSSNYIELKISDNEAKIGKRINVVVKKDMIISK